MRVELSIDDGVATIVLDAPPLNIFDVGMRDALVEVLDVVVHLDDVGAAVIAPSGPNLGAGADVREFGTADSGFDARRNRWDRDPWTRLVRFPVPTIAALRGIAYGSAFEMALLCDLRIAAPDVRLCLPEIKLGMLPAAGGTQSLVRLVGPHGALPAILTAGELGADAARRAGLVNEVADDPVGRAGEVARQLATVPRSRWSAVREVLRAAVDLPLEAGLEVERRQARILRGRDQGRNVRPDGAGPSARSR